MEEPWSENFSIQDHASAPPFLRQRIAKSSTTSPNDRVCSTLSCHNHKKNAIEYDILHKIGCLEYDILHKSTKKSQKVSCFGNFLYICSGNGGFWYEE